VFVKWVKSAERNLRNMPKPVTEHLKYITNFLWKSELKFKFSKIFLFKMKQSSSHTNYKDIFQILLIKKNASVVTIGLSKKSFSLIPALLLLSNVGLMSRWNLVSKAMPICLFKVIIVSVVAIRCDINETG
jgi:hypothetical protein